MAVYYITPRRFRNLTLFINNIRHRKPLPVYGEGLNVRDWLYVVDHARAIDLIFHEGKVADTYNIGGFNEWKNIDIVKVLINTTDRLLGRAEGEDMNLITHVTDRKGHDMRYAIDSRKITNFVNLMRDFEILEICRTGIISLERGSSTITKNVFI